MIKALKAQFITSAMTPEQFPLLKDIHGKPVAEIAFVGRSNVGKSSLLNHLIGKKIAHTSSLPGKTSTLNFFLIEEKWAFVDLPGYGFAKKAKEEQKAWSKAIDLYLNSREHLKLIFLLLDTRHLPSTEDLLFLNWLESTKKPFLLIFTKTDKLTPLKQTEAINKSLKAIGKKVNYLPYSIKDPKARMALLRYITNGTTP